MSELSRRKMIGNTALLLAGLRAESAFAAGPGGVFPKGFHWGASTASYQTEGNNIASDLWVLENVKPTIFIDKSGDADDSYNRYEEDIARLQSFGLNAYRFSIEWSRIEPVKGEFSNAELDHYKRMIAACRTRGVKPSVTFHHNSAPAWFAAEGGWLNDSAPQLFARYCDKVARALADQMEVAFTLNEPQAAEVLMGVPGLEFLRAWAMDRNSPYWQMKAAAAKAVGSTQFEPMFLNDPKIATPNLVKAHKLGFSAIKAVRGNLPVGVCLTVPDYQGVGENSKVEEVKQFVFGAWIEAARMCGDFVGVQNYDRFKIDANGPVATAGAGDPANGGGEFYPQSLGNAVKYIHDAVGKPIYVTENGMNTTNDAERIRLIDGALASLREVMQAGVPVLGYYHWSLLDNFEWSLGYKPKYGLVAVDRQTFKRTPKPSAFHYGAIARSNGKELNNSVWNAHDAAEVTGGRSEHHS